jgi:hypothetical protein
MIKIGVELAQIIYAREIYPNNMCFGRLRNRRNPSDENA